MFEDNESVLTDLRDKFDPTKKVDIFSVKLENRVKETPKPSFQDYSMDTQDMAYTTLSDGSKTAIYDSYLAGSDNEERLASKQSSGERWGNRMTNFLGKTGTAVIGGTAGVVYGVGEAIKQGSLDALYDNDFSNTLMDWDTKMGYSLANRYTKQEQESGFLDKSSGAWADDILGGLSFTAGAIVSEGIWAFATGGASVALAAPKWAAKTLGMTKAVAGVNKYKSFLKEPLLEAYRAGKISKQATINIGRGLEFANTTRFMLTSAGYESSVEALHFKKEAEENFFSGFLDKNGRQPTVEEITEFQELNKSTANAVFGANLALVGSSNLITMGTILGIKSPIKTGFSDFVDRKAFGYGIGKSLDDAGKTVYKTLEATRGQKVARNIYNWGKAPVTEGLYEEGLQGVTTKMANKFVEHSYDKNITNENLDMMGAFYESLSEQYGTKEGWHSNAVGMIVGAIGGSMNTRAELKNKKSNLEYKAAVATQFGEETLQKAFLPKRVMMMNQMQGFVNESKAEAQKGNILKSQMAQNSVLFSYINAKHALGEDLSDSVMEVRTALENMTADQWKDAGISNPKEYMDEAIAEYSSLTKQYQKNRKYWEYTIGKKLVGQDALGTGVLQDAFGKMNTNEMMIQALTWVSTTGENASSFMKDIQQVIANEVGVESATTLQTISKLKRQNVSTRGQITKAQNAKKGFTQERDTLVKQIAKLNLAPKETQGDKVKGTQIEKLSARLLEVNDKIASLENTLQGFVDQLNAQQNYKSEISANNLDLSSQNLMGETITTKHLESLNENIKKLQETIAKFNPQRKAYLDDLLKEYVDAEEVFLTNHATEMMIMSPNTKIEQIHTWLGGKMKGGKAMDTETNEWLTDVIQKYQKAKTKGDIVVEETVDISEEEFKDFKENGIVSDQRLIDLSNKVKDSVKLTEKEAEIAEAKKAEIDDILKQSRQKAQPKKEEAPTEEGLTPLQVYKQRITEILKKNSDFLHYYGDSYDGMADKKPTESEVEEYRQLKKEGKTSTRRYRELLQKLQNWKMADSMTDSENNSIAELADIIEQLEQEAEQEDTKDEFTPEDTAFLSEPIEGSGSVVDYTLAQNTNGSVTVKRSEDGLRYTFHHLKMESLVGNLEGELLINNKAPKSENAIRDLKIGDVVTIDGATFKYLAGGVIEMSVNDFNSRAQAFNLVIADTKAVNWSYKDVYTFKGGEFVKRQSEFYDTLVDAEAIYDLKAEDELSLVINDQDGYNASKIGGTKEQLKIYLQDSKGRIVSTLKALKQGATNEDYLLLRETVFARWEEAGRPEKMNAGVSVKVEGIFMGSPQLVIEDGSIQNIAFTERATQEVIATGYIEDGSLKLNTEIQDVSKVYVGKVSNANPGKKVPVVVFRKGNQNVAYPISMIKTSTPQTEVFDGILSSDLSAQEKVQKINDEIQTQKINTEKLVYSDIENTDKLDATREAFASKTTFVPASELAEPNYKSSRLSQDAQINIDLQDLGNVISDAKVRLNLGAVTYKTVKEVKYENKVQIVDRLNELSREIYLDFINNAATKYVNKKGDIIEDTKFTDTFDETPVEVATAFTNKVKNINTLREAFSEKLPAVVVNAIGVEKIEEVKKLFKNYDHIKSQIAVKPEELAEGLTAAQCN